LGKALRPNAFDDAHILRTESAVITGHTLKLNVLAPGAASLDVAAAAG
jgi:hypothetical protein